MSGIMWQYQGMRRALECRPRRRGHVPLSSVKVRGWMHFRTKKKLTRKPSHMRAGQNNKVGKGGKEKVAKLSL